MKVRKRKALKVIVVVVCVLSTIASLVTGRFTWWDLTPLGSMILFLAVIEETNRVEERYRRANRVRFPASDSTHPTP